jgi:Ca2+-binding EF-hand superfamily protein
MSERVRHAFRKLDTAGKGVILKDELAHVLRKLDPKTTDGELKILLSAAEVANDDPRVSYERFVSWLFCDAPEVCFNLGFLENRKVQTANSQSLCDLALASSIAEASEKHEKAKVESYFSDVTKRIKGPAFIESVRRHFSLKFGDGECTSGDDIVDLVESTLNYTADMVTVAKPSKSDIQMAFEAQRAHVNGRGQLGFEEVLDLVRVLQVRVALATLLEAENRAADDVRRFQAGETLRTRGLWQGSLAVAKAKASQRFSDVAVESYFQGVHSRLNSPEYAAHVKGEFFRQVDANKDGKVSFSEAIGVINSSFQCASDLGGSHKPTPEAIREAFDAHDTIEEGWGFMGGDEFLNLMRYLQVRVAEAMLPLSQLVKESEK